MPTTKRKKTAAKRGINKQRLLTAALAVLDAPRNTFTMSTYQHPCGTPACVLGNYAYRGDLQSTFKLGSVFVLTRTRGVLGPVSFSGPEIRKHFGITEEQAEELFGPQGCGNAQTPAQAAKYIIDFVMRGGKKAAHQDPS